MFFAEVGMLDTTSDLTIVLDNQKVTDGSF